MQVNKKILAMKLQATGNKTLCLQDFQGQAVVLYFYPKDDTPGCTTESNDFKKLYKKFQSHQTHVFGISRDNLASHEKFKSKYKFPFDLISDSDEVLCQAFHVLKEKNMYGKKVLGIERSTFVMDKDGKVIKEWRKVKVDGHASEVLDFVKKL